MGFCSGVQHNADKMLQDTYYGREGLPSRSSGQHCALQTSLLQEVKKSDSWLR